MQFDANFSDQLRAARGKVTIMPIQDIPLHTSTRVETDLLDFDQHNPRLAAEEDRSSGDLEIIVSLGRTSDLNELLQSIASNGYIDIEPLVVMQQGTRLRVLEGNRRLAAIKLLSNSKVASTAKITVPEITPAVHESLKLVSVYKVSSPEEAREYIGFKHINGPHKWDALAKAKFAADWYTSDRANGVTIKQIAKKLGDSNDTVLRLVQGMYVLEQAKNSGVFEIADRAPERTFAFSHLYTALTRPGYRNFLGLEPEWRADPSPNPIPEKNVENLGQVMRWLYGSKSENISPVIRSQNPNIKQLGQVLLNPTAKAVMLATSNLRDAFQQVEAPSDRFEHALISAVQHSETALAQIASADAEDDTVFALSQRLLKNATVIDKTLSAVNVE